MATENIYLRGQGSQMQCTEDLLAGSLSFAFAGGKAGAYIANSQVSPRYSASARTISAIATTVGTVATTGETRVLVIWSQPSPNSRTEATYVAS